MHHMPLERLGFDFVLSLSHAILFGLSMNFPGWFPIFLGCILFAAVFRQSKEHKHHIKRLYNDFRGKVILPGRGYLETEERKGLEAFKADFVDLLKHYPELSVWKPVTRWLPRFALILIVAGGIIWYFVRGPEPWQIFKDFRLPEYLIDIESAIIALFTWLYGRGVLRDRAAFLYDRKKRRIKIDDHVKEPTKDIPEIDIQFINFLEALEKKQGQARRSNKY
jgi:hypothetical protein